MVQTLCSVRLPRRVVVVVVVIVHERDARAVLVVVVHLAQQARAELALRGKAQQAGQRLRHHPVAAAAEQHQQGQQALQVHPAQVALARHRVLPGRLLHAQGAAAVALTVHLILLARVVLVAAARVEARLQP